MYHFLCNYMEFYSQNEPINILEVGHEICDKNYNIVRKTSPIFALEYIVSGNNFFTINETSFVANAGDVVFLPKDTYHDYKKHTMQCEKMWCVFDGKLVNEMIYSYLTKGNLVFHCPELINEFNSIIECCKLNSGNLEIIRSDISLIIHKILISLSRSLHIKSINTVEQKIIKHIDDNICKPFSLDTLSKVFGYTRNHIILIFKNAFGITPNKYYINKKIEVACLYLNTTNYSIKIISDNLGFADQHYFANSFNSIMKLTPSQYREQRPANDTKSAY